MGGGVDVEVPVTAKSRSGINRAGQCGLAGHHDAGNPCGSLGTSRTGGSLRARRTGSPGWTRRTLGALAALATLAALQGDSCGPDSRGLGTEQGGGGGVHIEVAIAALTGRIRPTTQHGAAIHAAAATRPSGTLSPLGARCTDRSFGSSGTRCTRRTLRARCPGGADQVDRTGRPDPCSLRTV